MTELVMAPPSLHQERIETGSEYTFSSSSLRKKKKKKKLRNKKFITTEEAASGKCPPRSRSTSALEAATSAVVTPPPPPPQPTPAVIAAPASQVQKESSKSKSRGQQELERELELSSHNRERRKPWETDIRKKEKTEYGDSLLRDGPCSADRVQSSSAASHHANFRRARSLSTTRHRSVSRQRSQSRRGRSSLQLFSDWHTSDSEEEYYREPEREEPSSFDDDEDVTYEKYRQFLASTKSNDEDDTLSRQSVLSLKQKVGAAPALEFSYRYSAAADELLNGENNYDDNNPLESKSNTEVTTNLTEPEDLSITAVPPMHEFLSDAENDENDNSTNGDNHRPIFPGSVMCGGDTRSDHEESDTQRYNQESSSVVEIMPSTPLHSPMSSPHPPYLTDSSSPLKQPPTPTSVTSEELSLPSFPQPPQEGQDLHTVKAPESPRLSKGKASIREQEMDHSFERESDIKQRQEEVAVSSHLSAGISEELTSHSEDGSEQAIFDTINKPQHEISIECVNGSNEALLSNAADFPTRQDDLSSYESKPRPLHKHNKISRAQESDPEINSPRPPSREPIQMQRLLKENVDSDGEGVDLYDGVNGCLDLELPTLRCPVQQPKSPYVVERTDPIEGQVEEENFGHPSDESDYQPTRRKIRVRDRSPIPNVAEIKPIQDTVKENDFQEAVSTEFVEMHDDDSIIENCDEESIEDMDDDSDYPQDDRMLLNMMYGIHMS